MTQVSRVFLGLGSNVGERLEYLSRAVGRIGQVASVRKCSSIYETEPVGMKNARPFYNMAIEIETTLTPQGLLENIKSIEVELGRTPHTHMLPREIDIDILLYGEEILRADALQIPHPELTERRFVLEPLSEIADKIVHPVLQTSISAVLKDCRDKAAVRRTSLSLDNMQSL